MEFLSIYLPVLAALLTATLIVETINGRRRAKRLAKARRLISAVETARVTKSARRKDGGGYL